MWRHAIGDAGLGSSTYKACVCGYTFSLSEPWFAHPFSEDDIKIHELMCTANSIYSINFPLLYFYSMVLTDIWHLHVLYLLMDTCFYLLYPICHDRRFFIVGTVGTFPAHCPLQCDGFHPNHKLKWIFPSIAFVISRKKSNRYRKLVLRRRPAASINLSMCL